MLKKIKGSTMYLVIVVALMIAIICSLLIVSAFFHQFAYERKHRYDILQNNFNSGFNFLLAENDTSYYDSKEINLFGGYQDSVSIRKQFWGLYDCDYVKSHIQNDTVSRAFLMANAIDSTKWVTLYLTENGRPLTVAGKTVIQGNVCIPSSGINSAYINGIAYTGPQNIVNGTKSRSAKELPFLEPVRLNYLQNKLIKGYLNCSQSTGQNLNSSFLDPTKTIKLKRNEISGIKNYSGNIIIFSDTTLVIDSASQLNNVLIFSKAIVIKDGFKGRGQFFATDSISIGKNCHFDYPSGLGLLDLPSSNNEVVKTNKHINIGENTQFTGLIFCHSADPSASSSPVLNNIIDIGKHVKITGQLYSNQIIMMRDSVCIVGSISCKRLLYRTNFSIFENFLVNVTLDNKTLSRYYLTSDLLPAASKKKRILQWLQ